MFSSYLTTSDVARRLGCRAWQVGRLFERGILPDPPRIGNFRVVPVEDLEKVKAALQTCGYLPAEPTTKGAA